MKLLDIRWRRAYKAWLYQTCHTARNMCTHFCIYYHFRGISDQMHNISLNGYISICCMVNDYNPNWTTPSDYFIMTFIEDGKDNNLTMYEI